MHPITASHNLPTSHPIPPAYPINRSTLLRSIVLASPPLLINVPNSLAASSLPLSPTLSREGSISSFLPALPPEPIALPRRRLDQTFAVLLLRSGYEAVDDLDFIPMDVFQRVFWKYRQSEWQPYTFQYAPLLITQGDLTDPLYFDFISCMQFSAVQLQAIPDAKQVFKEVCDPEEEASTCTSEGFRIVTRSPETQNNAALPALFEQRTGERIYQGLVDGFRGVQFGGPRPLPLKNTSEKTVENFDAVLKGCRDILNIFVERGYAISADLEQALESPQANSKQFVVTVKGPASLWSLQALASKRADVYNAYDALTLAAYLRACGYTVQSCELSWTSSSVVERWTVV